MPGVLYARYNGQWVPISSGGGGASEVEIGTDDPIGANSAAELWFDTDDDTVAGPTAMAGNALGVLAIGTFTFGDGAALTPGAAMTNPLVQTLLVGRRYRVSFGMRAVQNAGNVSPTMNLRDNGVDLSERWRQQLGGVGYTGWESQWLLTGDGASHTLLIWYGPGNVAGTVGYSGGGYFYIEDVGPTVASALPLPATAPPWTQAGLVNGWAVSGAAPSYRRIGDIVALRGAGSGAGAAAGSTMLQLPVGFRPPVNLNFPVVAATQTVSYVTIDTSGNVTPPSGANKDYISLSAISFSVTP